MLSTYQLSINHLHGYPRTLLYSLTEFHPIKVLVDSSRYRENRIIGTISAMIQFAWHLLLVQK